MTRRKTRQPAPVDALAENVRRALERSETILDRAAVDHAIDQMAIRITLELHDRHPVVVCIMNGGIVLTADLLERLRFPLELDYLHVTRYGESTRGGELVWRALPQKSVAGRTVLLVDDILDEGNTLAAAVVRMRELGASDVRTAVLVQKDLGRAALVEPDFCGCRCPNRYVFGRGMDYCGHWRNLAEIRALSGDDSP